MNLPPSLEKEQSQVNIENFYRALFGKKAVQFQGLAKQELIKLHNCSRDYVECLTLPGTQAQKEMSYEKLSQQLDDLLKEKGYWD